MTVRINDILEEVSGYIPDADTRIIEKAYVFSARVHQGQTRLSGEPYLNHPLEVAYLIAQMHLDVTAVAAALLHDTIEDSLTKVEDIAAGFGEEVAQVVDGLTKISKIDFRSEEEQQAENFRKMILAMSKDLRILLIKLTDRLHNMRTLQYHKPRSQERIARETLEIYAPLANRLGIHWLQIELEELSLKYLDPMGYKTLKTKLEDIEKAKEAYLTGVMDQIRSKLESVGINAEVKGRIKHVYSLYQKLRKQGIPFEDVYDVMGMRIIVSSVAECYETLGIIHSIWKPIQSRIKDFIAMPKANMYQSLHTKIIGPHGEKIEIQIRTREMHRLAEEGIAAHWKYKEGKVFNPKEDKIFAWLRRVIEWQQELKDNKEFMEVFKIDLFPDEVYVFTPNGDVRELPKGATPVDFAYAIHSELGHRCVGAKVSGKLVPLRSLLKSGDTVEIMTSPTHKPSKDWLSFVATSKAKTKIRQWIKTEQRERSIELGRSLLDKELSKHDMSFSRLLKSGEFTPLAKEFSFESVDDLFASVGYGLYTPLQVLNKIIPETEKPVGKIKSIISSFKKGRDDAIKIKGIDGLVIRFAKCCNPIPGDNIIGFITRGRGLTVHVEDCPNVHTYDEQRKVEVSWQLSKNYTFPVRFKVTGSDRKGLLSDISSVIAANKVNILSAQAMAYPDRSAAGIYEVEIEHMSQLQKVMKSIQKIKGVRSVDRMRSIT